MISTAGFYNTGTQEEPSLQVFLNLDNLVDLRDDTVWSGGAGSERYAHLRADGFEGVQITTDEEPPKDAVLPHCGLDRISTPDQADSVAYKHADRGDLCITVHAGWGMESDDEVDRLMESILSASERYALPIFLETHRATITQDVWRTVQIARRFPQVRFNGDFSHYYCGQELVYGDWQTKLRFMQPIFERTAFLHGRIASPGCMQSPIDADLTQRPRAAHGVLNYLEHFRDLWTNAMAGFLRHAVSGDLLIFAPELLAGTYYYARLFPDGTGRMQEESDRYAQALLYKTLARECFAAAQQIVIAEKANRKETGC